ncbi:MAG: right-handed parallel beta-helix repeat-containing protein, partial [Clostridia bacterium]|nr:right-handed parallel beta-helix repeat-containing protein [Clostridia bacterium]
GSATANLSGVLISDCWSDKAITYQNDGGAIYMRDNAKVTMKNCVIRNCRAVDYGGAIYMETDGNRLTCENVDIISCTADENQGGGVYQDYGETTWIGGSIKNCHTGDDDGGGFYVNNDKVFMQNVLFDGNSAHDNGGAFCSDSDDGAWFIGCTFQRNNAEDLGGAVYVDNDNIYMEDCTVVSNSSGDEGGGIYIAGSSTIGVAGVVVIRSSDGTGSHDNLVLGNNAYIYNHGLQPGSEIRLRSDSDGSVKLGGGLMSEYQLNQYFRADYGKLELTETQTVNTELRASVFSEGNTALIIGALLLIAVLAGGVIYYRKKRKGGAQ